MSYDVRIGVKVEGMNGYIAVIDEPKCSSPTYNLREMFVACMGWDYTQGEWYNLTEVFPKFRRGQEELMIHPQKYKKYNSKNGWGSVSSALEFLNSFVEKIGEIVSGDGSWNEIPLEHLWMRW